MFFKNSVPLKSLLGFVLLSILAVSTQAMDSDFILPVGSVKVLKVGGITRIAVGNEEVVKASVLETGELMLIPQQAGESKVLVWTTGERLSTFRISVFDNDMSKTVAMAQSILKTYDSVSVRAVHNRLLIEGAVDPRYFTQFEDAVTKAFPEALMLVKQVPRGEMIEFKVRILEVQKRYRRELGIDWDDSVQGPILGTFGTFLDNPAYALTPESSTVDWEGIGQSIPIGDNDFYPFGRLATSISSRIQLLQENGLGRILAEPTLTTQTGSAAKFLAGGQIPYQTVNQIGQTTVEFQDYGIQLEIEPQLVGKDTIISTVKAEVSSIDSGTSVNGVPGLLTRETESSVSLRPGQTLAISGLLSSSDSKAIQGLPFLSKIPIIGELFKSKGFQEQRTELIVLVTPKIIDTAKVNYSDRSIFEHAESLENLLIDGSQFDEDIAD